MRMYFGGMPTNMDVKRLREELVMIEGDEVTHEQVEKILGVKHTVTRFRTITDKWRRVMLIDEGLEIVALPGLGFRCLLPDERVGYNFKGFKQGTRKQGRHLRRAAMIPRDRVSEKEVVKLDHFQRLGALLMGQAHSMVRQIEPPPPRETPPDGVTPR
jgi:hypothetical protein